jgi:RHS repeat-associated protein
MKPALLLSLSALSLSGGLFAQAPYPGNDSDSGVTRPRGLIDSYTGNVAFATHDLSVSGVKGQFHLSWGRHAMSRTAQSTPYFGLAHNWTHNWQWELVDAGTDGSGRAVLSLREPAGKVFRFTQTSATAWWPAPSVTERLFVSGDVYRIVRNDATEVHFKRSITSSGVAFDLAKLVDGAGNVWTITTAGGKVTQITEPAGRWLKVAYATLSAPNANSSAPGFTVITGVVASDGRSIAYEYAFPSGADYPCLAKVRYPDETTASYVYENGRSQLRALLTRADDPHADGTVRGRTVRYRTEADAAQGQVADIRALDGTSVMHALTADARSARSYSAKQPNGAVVYQTFSSGGILTEEIDPLGYGVRSEYDANGRGFRVAKSDALGRTTRFENDSNGHLTKETFADGRNRRWEYDGKGRLLAQIDELGHKTTRTYDSLGRLVKEQYPDASANEVVYNDETRMEAIKARNGAATTKVFDSRGMLTKVVDALGHTKKYTYDEFDRVAGVTDPLGREIKLTRDKAGRVIKRSYVDGTTVSATYNDFGQLTKQTDAAGASRTFAYDDFGRLTSAFDPLGQQSRLEYGSLGQGGPLQGPVRVTDGAGRSLGVTYDAKGHVVARTMGAGTNEAATVRYKYDAANHLTQRTDGGANSTQFYYDDRGHRTKVVDALNQQVRNYTFDAAGHKTSTTNAAGEVSKWTYDSMGRVLTVTNAEGAVVRRQYDAAGRLAATVDGNGNTHRYEYDTMGRPIALIYPDGSRETKTYNAIGKLATETSRAGVTRTYTYDARNREILSEWNDAGRSRLVKAYDSAGRMILEDNGVSKITYAYDIAGRLVSETQDLGSVATGGRQDAAPRTVKYLYDPSGRRTAMTYPDGTTVRYTYNARGGLQSVIGDGGLPPIVSYRYDNAGNVTDIERENETETSLDYDVLNRVVGIVDENPRGRRLAEEDYEYNAADQRVSTTHAFGNGNGEDEDEVTRDTYYYDKNNAVIGADYQAPVEARGRVGKPAATERFSYDAVGNRLTAIRNGKITSYGVNSLNEYVRVGSQPTAYDAAGNMTRLDDWTYEYDALNRMIKATDGHTVARFYYDAKNRCVARSYNGDLTLNYYDGWNLIQECDGNGKTVARNFFGRRVDEVVLVVNKSGIFYPHHDVLGNVTFLTDERGRLVERYVYGVAGEVTVVDGQGQRTPVFESDGRGPKPRSRVGNRWMYTGREWLAEIGLYDYRNRVYAPTLGRFMQNDPIRFSGRDLNLYRYVDNAFVKHTDPMGEQITAGGLFTLAGEIELFGGGPADIPADIVAGVVLIAAVGVLIYESTQSGGTDKDGKMGGPDGWNPGYRRGTQAPDEERVEGS